MPPSLYIHIPVCISKCSYCDFFSLPLKEVASFFSFERFANALLNEIRAKQAIYGAKGFSTVYVGGGTPSLIPHGYVSSLCEGIRQISSAPPLEWTVEMNPADVTAEKLKAWRDGGASRLSLGVQSFSVKSLKAIGRRGSRDESIAALSLASSIWEGDISVDLIAGLPCQSVASLRKDIEAALTFNPAHVSLYQLALEEGTPLFALNADGAVSLPDDDEAAIIWNAGKDMLVNAGLSRYEVSNFALKGHESRHNMAYWRLNSFIGAGPGASGTLARGDACTRFENTKDIERWLLFWENEGSDEASLPEKHELNKAPMRIEQVGRADFAFETLMMGMRLTCGISEADFSARFPEGLDGLFGAALQKWERAGRLKREGGRVALTEEGLLFLNAFLLECLDELKQKEATR